MTDWANDPVESAENEGLPVEDAAEDEVVEVSEVVEEPVLRLVAADDAPDDLRVAFAGSHDVEGADEDGFVTLPAEVTTDQASAAQGVAFTAVETD